MKHRKLLLASILASLLVHVGTLCLLSQHAFFLGERTERRKLAELAHQKNLVLRQVFVSSPRGHSNLQAKLTVRSIPDPIQKPEARALNLTAHLKAKLAPSVEKPCSALFDLAPQLKTSVSYKTILPVQISPHPWQGPPALAAPVMTPVLSPPELAGDPPQLEERARAAFAFPPLPPIPTLADLQTLSPDDAFDIELEVVREGEKGALFALTLLPHQNLELPRIPQRYTFLIDRSNSIQQARLKATKSALLKVLQELDPDDTFNIIVFDSKVSKAFPKPVSPTDETISAATSFINQTELGSLFAPADLYNPLALTLPPSSSSDEHHTVILFTDGDSFAKDRTREAIFQHWSVQNGGKVSLYTVGLESDPYLIYLEAAAACNRGKAVTASTGRGLKRRLAKLMRSLHDPIAQEISCTAYSRKDGALIPLYPTQKLPSLFKHEPLVIWGRTDSLDDLLFVIQGKLKEGWLTIRKEVSFSRGKRGGERLRNHFAHLVELGLAPDPAR